MSEDTTEEFLRDMFVKLMKQGLEKKELTQATYNWLILKPMMTLDELSFVYGEFLEALDNKERHFLEERIAKGAAYIERTDITEAQRQQGKKLYDALITELEKLNRE